MWGGSYAGYDQWATAKEFPSHLATIVPVASPKPGVDYPMRNNIFYPYDMQWLTFVSGQAGQDKIFGDSSFWSAQFRALVRSARAVHRARSLCIGNPSPIFHTWIEHPAQDAYWDSYSPTREQYAQDRSADPDDHRPLRRRSAGRDGVLSRVHARTRPQPARTGTTSSSARGIIPARARRRPKSPDSSSARHRCST